MKANELRIGNLVNVEYKGKILLAEVCLIDHESSISSTFDRQADLVNGMICHPKDLIPIQLTEDRLLKMGFNVKESIWYSKKTSIRWVRFEVCIKEKRCILFNSKSINFCDMQFPKYVHHLQNLYFTLTGDELTLIEKP